MFISCGVIEILLNRASPQGLNKFIKIHLIINKKELQILRQLTGMHSILQVTPWQCCAASKPANLKPITPLKGIRLSVAARTTSLQLFGSAKTIHFALVQTPKSIIIKSRQIPF